MFAHKQTLIISVLCTIALLWLAGCGSSPAPTADTETAPESETVVPESEGEEADADNEEAEPNIAGGSANEAEATEEPQAEPEASPAEEGEAAGDAAPDEQFIPEFVCSEEYDWESPAKPAIPIDNLIELLPAPFYDLPLDQERAIAFNFATYDASQVAVAVRADCKYVGDYEELGVILGVIWQYFPDEEYAESMGVEMQPSYIISVHPETEQGYAWAGDSVIDLTMSVEQLVLNDSPIEPIEIESFIPGPVCFRNLDLLYCSRTFDNPILGFFDKIPPEILDSELRVPIEAAQTQLIELGLLEPNTEIYGPLSEIEDPFRIEECSVGESPCAADFVFASTNPGTVEFGESVVIAIASVLAPIDQEYLGYDLIAPGFYVIEATVTDDSIAPPVMIRGLEADLETIYSEYSEARDPELLVEMINEIEVFNEVEMEIASVLAPYARDGAETGGTQISSACIWRKNVCILGESQ